MEKIGNYYLDARKMSLNKIFVIAIIFENEWNNLFLKKEIWKFNYSLKIRIKTCTLMLESVNLEKYINSEEKEF